MEQYNVNVYKIWFDDAPDDFYIGSTKRTLSQRMSNHRFKCRKGSGVGSKLYNIMREKGVNNFKYILVDSSMVTCSDEQRKFEQKYMNELKPTLNTVRAFRTHENRLKQHRDCDDKRRGTPEYRQQQREKRRRQRSNPAFKEREKAMARQRSANKKFARELHDFIHS